MKWVLLILLVYSFGTFAQDLLDLSAFNTEPLRNIQDVAKKKTTETVSKLEDAKVMIADYDLIRRDFPEVRAWSNMQIDQWLLDQTAYISQGQINQTKVNNAIPVLEETRKAVRPEEYGRALVYEVTAKNKKIGLIDVKGAGGINPSHASHNSGTMTLGEALREFSYEKNMTTVISHTGIQNKVVGSYAVISAGFDVIHADGSKSSAGLYLRQAHRRYTQAETRWTAEPRGNGWMLTKERGMYKELLNRYGIFANENFQGTVNNDLFDFGHYIIRDDLPQLDPKLAVPFDQWGYELASGEKVATDGEGRWKMSKRDRPWMWSHDTAEAFVKGQISRHDVWMHHYNLLNPVQRKLKDVPRIYSIAKTIGFAVRECEAVFDRWGKN